jgi:hypothetical protein
VEVIGEKRSTAEHKRDYTRYRTTSSFRGWFIARGVYFNQVLVQVEEVTRVNTRRSGVHPHPFVSSGT